MLGTSGSMGMMPGHFYRVPQMGGDIGLEEEPLYVNAKQYHRILKRRQARARLDAQIKIQREKVWFMRYGLFVYNTHGVETIHARVPPSSCHEATPRTWRAFLDGGRDRRNAG